MVLATPAINWHFRRSKVKPYSLRTTVYPADTEGLHKLACYLMRAPVNLSRLRFDRGSGLLVYETKHGHELDDDALTDPQEFLARGPHPPGRKTGLRASARFGVRRSTSPRARQPRWALLIIERDNSHAFDGPLTQAFFEGLPTAFVAFELRHRELMLVEILEVDDHELIQRRIAEEPHQADTR